MVCQNPSDTHNLTYSHSIPNSPVLILTLLLEMCYCTLLLLRMLTKLVHDNTDTFYRISMLYYEMGEEEGSLRYVCPGLLCLVMVRLWLFHCGGL